MLLSEMFDHILIRSGQFLLGANKIEVNMPRFVSLVKGALGIYSGYQPVDFTFNLRMQNNRRYKFEKTFRPEGQDQDWGIPKFISGVTPTNIAGSPAFTLMGQFGSKLGWQGSTGNYGNSNFSIPGQTQMESQQMEKSQFPWVWRSPYLFIPYSADVEVIACYDHKIFVVPPDETEGGQEDYFCDTVNFSNDEFFDLLEGMFLLALGQSRRAFTMNDLPIVSDADTLASRGQELKAEAILDLTTNKHRFYLAYGD